MGPAAPDWHGRQQVMNLLRGYRQAQVLITGAELGLFDVLASEPRTAAEVAAHVGADQRGIELWLNAAAALGLLHKQGDRYANSPLAAAYLAVDGPCSLGCFVAREAAFYRRWGRLSEAVRSGQRPTENRRDEEPANWVRDFELALYGLARLYGPLIAEALRLPAGRPLAVLDVGGGHGGYSLALARHYPQLTAVVFELPRVVPVTQEIAAAEGLAERVTAQAGDFRTDDLGAGYDVALLFGVLNGEPPEGRAALIRKVFQALKPHGLVVVRELALDPDRAGPPEAALFALQMLLATERGGLSTAGELYGWLRDAGFRGARTIALPAGEAAPLIVAEKPGSGRAAS